MDDLTKAIAKASLKAESKSISSETDDVVTVVNQETDMSDIVEHFREVHLLAMDCEGVDLGRSGQLCLVQLSTPKRSFLFDVHDVPRDAEMVSFLRNVLESEYVIKIIHDCKMDSDALFHILDITLTNVHDTQAWDHTFYGEELNLNRTLQRSGCKPNVARDCSVYDRNPSFWATRPLTPTMIEWATGDVASLFELHQVQVDRVQQLRKRSECERKSLRNVMFLRNMMIQATKISGQNIGRFIGRGGSNIAFLKRQVPDAFFRLQGKGHMVVYAQNQSAMDRAIALLRPYKWVKSKV